MGTDKNIKLHTDIKAISVFTIQVIPSWLTVKVERMHPGRKFQ